MPDSLKILFVGDVVGAPGRALCKKLLPELKVKLGLDGIIINGENAAADGRGITPSGARFLLDQCGADIITSGNHIFAKREIQPFFAQEPRLLRPGNFPGDCPGSGVFTVMMSGVPVSVINVQGRVFMRELLSCPLRTAQSYALFAKSKSSVIIIDMHAETTAEKLGLAYFLDGKVSAVLGTHTHVPTADERILPQGTGFISDVGACCSTISMIGMKKDPIVQNLLTQLPVKFEVEQEGPYILRAVLMTIDTKTGKCLSIKRYEDVVNELDLDDPSLKDK